jgi:hypothetical protein
MDIIAKAWLPRTKITHPWPDTRIFAKYQRWEPGA